MIMTSTLQFISIVHLSRVSPQTAFIPDSIFGVNTSFNFDLVYSLHFVILVPFMYQSIMVLDC